MQSKFFIYSLGCKVNTYESESVKEDLINEGYFHIQEIEEANYIIVNTCCVTNTAQAKSRQKINSLHQKNPHAKIIVMGCYVQGFKNEIDKMDFVDLVVGTKNRNKIKDYIHEVELDKKVDLVTELNPDDKYERLFLSSYSENTRAFLKIQDGCNNFCSYCIIPYVRGNIKSRPYDDVLNEANLLINKGYKEIVLTGIHTGSYGKDLNDMTFSDLVEKLLKIEGLYRLRISSIEESEIDDKLINLLKNNPKLAHHFHIPLQAGSDHVLSLMNRKYKINDFVNKIKLLQNQVKDISITTDIIVGFPQETEEDFVETLKVSKYIPFSKIHVFPYSPRNNTVAAKMIGQIDGLTKKDRVKRLTQLSNKLNKDFNEKYVAEIVEILVEEVDEKIIGHTSNFIKVICKKNDNEVQKNDIINVKIIKAFADYVLAERIN